LQRPIQNGPVPPAVNARSVMAGGPPQPFLIRRSFLGLARFVEIVPRPGERPGVSSIAKVRIIHRRRTEGASRLWKNGDRRLAVAVSPWGSSVRLRASTSPSTELPAPNGISSSFPASLLKSRYRCGGQAYRIQFRPFVACAIGYDPARPKLNSVSLTPFRSTLPPQPAKRAAGALLPSSLRRSSNSLSPAATCSVAAFSTAARRKGRQRLICCPFRSEPRILDVRGCGSARPG